MKLYTYWRSQASIRTRNEACVRQLVESIISCDLPL